MKQFNFHALAITQRYLEHQQRDNGVGNTKDELRSVRGREWVGGLVVVVGCCFQYATHFNTHTYIQHNDDNFCLNLILFAMQFGTHFINNF